jgi:hypothetical protein
MKIKYGIRGLLPVLPVTLFARQNFGPRKFALVFSGR